MENYNRITKPNARKMFNRGCDILLLPCKVGESALDGTHSFIRPVKINILSCPHLENNFDRTVNEYEYYNCNAELGYYAQYFVTDEELEKYNMCEMMCD